jgi:hypothetical protein
MTDCIAEVERRGLEEEGIYRISGQLGRVNSLLQQFAYGRAPIDREDIHVVAGALKKFIRELKEPLVPSKCLQALLAALGLLTAGP